MTNGYKATLATAAKALLLVCGVTLTIPSTVAYSVQLTVPFKAQLPPPGTLPTSAGWHLTNNCGQTSVLMVVGFYSGPLRTPPTPANQDIQDADDWLFTQYGAPQNGYYGSATDTTQLVSLAQHYGFSDSASYSGWTTQNLQAELSAGHPVIVAVWTNMTVGQPYAANVNKRHFMVLTGMDDTYVYVNDPGHTDGGQLPYNRYTISQFQTAWSSPESHQNAAVVVIHPSISANGSVTVDATLDGQAWSSGQTTLAYTVINSALPGSVITNAALPDSQPSLPVGQYSLVYSSGVPPNATFTGIACPPSVSSNSFGTTTRAVRRQALLAPPTCTQQLGAGQTLTFTLQFSSNLLPVAGFTMSSGTQSATDGQSLTVIVAPPASSAVQFDAGRSSPSATQWNWTINGSLMSTSKTWTNAFAAGRYVVMLTVSDSLGNQSAAVQGVLVVVRTDLPIQYTITDLGALVTGGSSSGMIINSAGEVTGDSTDDKGNIEAFIWSQSGGLRSLGTVIGFSSIVPLGINSSGQIVGGVNFANSTVSHAFYFNGTLIQDIHNASSTASTIALAINDNDQMLASLYDPTNGILSCNLQMPPGPISETASCLGAVTGAASVMNNRGGIAGQLTESFTTHLFYYNGVLQADLGIPPWANNAIAHQMSDIAHITGIAFNPCCNAETSAFYNDGVAFQAIGTGGARWNAQGINNLDQVVGGVKPDVGDTGTPFGFLWIPNNGNNWLYLDSMLPQGSGWSSLSASSINDLGEIAGTGQHNGITRAFLLSPIYP